VADAGAVAGAASVPVQGRSAANRLLYRLAYSYLRLQTSTEAIPSDLFFRNAVIKHAYSPYLTADLDHRVYGRTQ